MVFLEGEMNLCSIAGSIPLETISIHQQTESKHSFSSGNGVLFDCSTFGHSITVNNGSGLFGAFGGVPVTENEALQWLKNFETIGWQFLSDIHKPVWVFAHNPHRHETVLAIDRYRINWLYWTVKQKKLYFASTVRGLLAWTKDTFRVDSNALFSYLDLLCVSAELSIQSGVKKLVGGKCLRVYDGKLETLSYHTISYRKGIPKLEADLALEIRKKIQGSVDRHLSWISDETFGCFLSGGTDSSSLLGTSFLARGSGIPAYSVTFNEDNWDELEFARIAAETFSAKHSVIRFDMEDALRISEVLSLCHDEPMGNPSLLATYKCLETAAQDGIKFMIAGDGGDEIFGGNERYSIDAVYSRFHRHTPRFIFKTLRDTSGILSSFLNSNLIARIHRIIERADRPNPERYYLDDAFAYKIYPQAFTKLLAGNFNPNINLEIFTNYYNETDAEEEIDRLLYIDMRHTLGDNDLVKVGICGRANNVAILYPMLDDDLVEFACRLPASAKLKGKEKRFLFKKAMSGLVPETILHKKKQGFGVPVSHWLRSSLKFFRRIEEVVFDRGGLVLEVLDEPFLRILLKEHQMGHADSGMFLWGLYSLNLWFDSANRWKR
jgi:asparagine synthase (glutamine-hydrolysing)